MFGLISFMMHDCKDGNVTEARSRNDNNLVSWNDRDVHFQSWII